MDHVVWLAMMLFFAATLYSSIGHAGASAYLAAMALVGAPAELMKPTALCLNIIVATIGTIQFARAGYFSWRIYWPFAVTSIPCAFIGGAIRLPYQYYNTIVGVVLVFAAARLMYSTTKTSDFKTRPLPIGVALVFGAAIGLLAGLTGVGGGIFLSPLLLLAHWADVKQTAAVSVAFILANSVAGLAGNLASLHYLPPQIPLFAVVVGIGGILGSYFGSRRLAPSALKFLLGVVLLVAGIKLIVG
jgi:uncharacterized membrane protein YfcA